MTEHRAAPRWNYAITLGDLLDQRAHEHGEHTALTFPGSETSYAALARRADSLARSLLGLGVRAGDAVGILLPNCADSIAALFGAMKIGAVPVPVNARFKEYELHQVVSHSRMRVLLTSGTSEGGPDFVSLLHTTFPALGTQPSGELRLDEAPDLRNIVLLSEHDDSGENGAGLVSAAEFSAAAERVPAEDVARGQRLVRIRDIAMVMYTSGTTASPKGAMLSHEALTRFAAATVDDRFSLTPEDRVWTALPLFHIGGIAFAIASVFAGSTYCHVGHFQPDTALDILESQKCTVALPGFETIWLPVVDQPSFAERDLSALRIVMVVGVPERLRDLAGRIPTATHVSCFGMTEASSFLSLNHLSDSLEQRVTTGGHPLPGMGCRVIDPETGDDVPAGTEGELLFRGSNCFDGYYLDPELTDEVFDEQGWFHTGDIATMDQDGRVTFVSRLKDMLKVGGENVSAVEVEGFLLRHPAVRMAQVVAAPDKRYVEVPAAFLELKDGATATEEEIIEFCLGNIATYRVPRYVRFVTEWPMSGTKIKKYVLRERIAEELAERGISQAPKLVAGTESGRHTSEVLLDSGR